MSQSERELFENLAKPFRLNMVHGDHYIYADTLRLYSFFEAARAPLLNEIRRLTDEIEELKAKLEASDAWAFSLRRQLLQRDPENRRIKKENLRTA